MKIQDIRDIAGKNTIRMSVHPDLSAFGAEMIMLSGRPAIVFDSLPEQLPDGWEVVNDIVRWNTSSISLSVLRQLFPSVSKDNILRDVDVISLGADALDSMSDKESAGETTINASADEAQDNVVDAPDSMTNDSQTQPASRKDVEKNARKIDDAGKKIGGAKKDRYARLSTAYLVANEVAGMNQLEIDNDIKKSKLIPFNLKAAIRNEMDVDQAIMVHAIIGALPAFNPAVQWRIADRDIAKYRAAATFYTQSMVKLRDILLSQKTIGYRQLLLDVKLALKDIAITIADIKADGGVAYEPLEAGMRIDCKNGRRYYSIGQRLTEESVQDIVTDAMKVFERHEYASMSADEIKEDVAVVKRDPKEKNEELLTPYSRPHLASIKRTGLPTPRDGDITPEQLIATYGFRAVEFGKWLPDDERQDVLNKAFDAFHTLSMVLGIDPADIGLAGIADDGGGMAIAFGARGNGGRASASAHWEPARTVINLTRLSGAGSLAHEYGHALDQYISKMCKTGDVSVSRDEHMFSEQIASKAGGFYRAPEPMHKETSKTALKLAGHTYNLMHDLVFAPKPGVNQILDKYDAAHEVYLDAVRVGNAAWKASDKSDDIPVRQRQYCIDAKEVQDKTIDAAKADLAKMQFEFACGRKEICRELAARSTPGFEQELPVSPGVLSPDEEGVITAWGKYVIDIIRAPAVDGNHGTQNYATFSFPRHMARLLLTDILNSDMSRSASIYHIAGVHLDTSVRKSKYFSTPVELFARAFESFIEDRIVELSDGGCDEYLVYGTHGINNSDIRYPVGWEREEYNRRFTVLAQRLSEHIYASKPENAAVPEMTP